MKELYCDKCGSGRIEDTVLDMPNEKIEPTKMSEWTGYPRVTVVQAVMKYYRHRLKCLNCGFETEYTN